MPSKLGLVLYLKMKAEADFFLFFLGEKNKVLVSDNSQKNLSQSIFGRKKEDTNQVAVCVQVLWIVNFIRFLESAPRKALLRLTQDDWEVLLKAI